MNKRIKKKKEKQRFIELIQTMELGNLVFGNSRGLFRFPDRGLVHSEAWQALCEKAQVDQGYGTPLIERDFYGFDNDVFTIRPYYWGDDIEIAKLPNFEYKPTGFKIDWYKYAFRDAFMNKNLAARKILSIFKKCADSIADIE